MRSRPMADEVKVTYERPDGLTSQAYVDTCTLEGTNRYTDEPVRLARRDGWTFTGSGAPYVEVSRGDHRQVTR